jgi:hypothetical protein
MSAVSAVVLFAMLTRKQLEFMTHPSGSEIDFGTMAVKKPLLRVIARKSSR